MISLFGLYDSQRMYDCYFEKKKKTTKKHTHTHKQNVTSGYYILKRELLKVISLEEHEK